MNIKTTPKEYTEFIKAALSNGFTDDQADFMWDFVEDIWNNFSAHSHKDGEVEVNSDKF